MNHYYVTRGSSVQLPCAYTHTVDSQQYTEVLWSIESADREEQPIIWFTGGRLYSDLYKPMEGRVHFTSADPRNGDASITIKDVRLSDKEMYRCLVKKLPELDKKILDLTVIEAPSQPLCSVDKDSMTLKCSSLQGTPPLHYIWSKTTGNKVLPTQAIVDPTEPPCISTSPSGSVEAIAARWKVWWAPNTVTFTWTVRCPWPTM
ncbi:coxsackievirus and adenovirus receptor homolog [Corythoichthys intestinalis]|uniref:coxsackievirus and adenovirus receptor homolog n=1 Tax=Corythoichthys intestinalis TaxID=161448 RepID=UPI0025A559E8|nr:coxsackievirus and adenovirus receptor homolog [Corythoichthys intestinalis]